jgi:hypothetical protein
MVPLVQDLAEMPALRLVQLVIGGNFLLCAGTLVGCFITANSACTGEKISEQLALVTTQAFALYFAEQGAR